MNNTSFFSKVGDVLSAGRSRIEPSISTTATTARSFGDSSAGNATRESACWETVLSQFEEHSSTCRIHLVFVFQSGRILRSGVDNWELVQGGGVRYFDAAMRHTLAWHQGEIRDPESGLHHLAHATTCLLFLVAKDLKRAKKKGQKE